MSSELHVGIIDAFMNLLSKLAATAAVVLLIGCGSNQKRTADTPTATSPKASLLTRQQAARQYLSDVAPVNAAGDKLRAKARQWTGTTTAAQIAADVRPYTDALTALRPKLLALARTYPSAATDIKTLVDAYGAEQGDLASASAQNEGSAAEWLRSIASDGSKATAAADVVRSDLGLPPKS